VRRLTHASAGSLRRVGKFVVVNNACHGKQMQNVQAMMCHSDHDRITGAASKFGDCDALEVISALLKRKQLLEGHRPLSN
jgi:hypothetical protein